MVREGVLGNFLQVPDVCSTFGHHCVYIPQNFLPIGFPFLRITSHCLYQGQSSCLKIGQQCLVASLVCFDWRSERPTQPHTTETEFLLWLGGQGQGTRFCHFISNPKTRACTKETMWEDWENNRNARTWSSPSLALLYCCICTNTVISPNSSELSVTQNSENPGWWNHHELA